MGGALALDAAWLFAAVLVVIIGAAVGIAARRFLLERGGGTVECGLRKANGSWRLGLASYQREELYWFSVFRVSMRPEETFPRRDLAVVSRRLPSEAEAASLGPGMIVVECQLGETPPDGPERSNSSSGAGPSSGSDGSRADASSDGSGSDGSGSGLGGASSSSGSGSGSCGAEAIVELAMAESALTGLLAWLEAAPPGSHLGAVLLTLRRQDRGYKPSENHGFYDHARARVRDGQGRSPPGFQSTSSWPALAARARMNSRSDSRFR